MKTDLQPELKILLEKDLSSLSNTLNNLPDEINHLEISTVLQYACEYIVDKIRPDFNVNLLLKFESK